MKKNDHLLREKIKKVNKEKVNKSRRIKKENRKDEIVGMIAEETKLEKKENKSKGKIMKKRIKERKKRKD